MPSWLTSSTTPSATTKAASLVSRHLEKGSPWSCGRDRAIFLTCWRWGRRSLRGGGLACALRRSRWAQVTPCTGIIHTRSMVHSASMWMGA